MTLIQSTNIYVDDDNLSLEDLPEHSPLLMFSSPVEHGFLMESDNDKHSFIMSKKLYNGVKKSKDVKNRIFVSYNNEGGRYNHLRKNIKRGIFSVIGKLKISKTKMLHLIAQEIEWNLISATSNDTVNNDNNADEKELEAIENNYIDRKEKKRKLFKL